MEFIGVVRYMQISFIIVVRWIPKTETMIIFATIPKPGATYIVGLWGPILF